MAESMRRGSLDGAELRGTGAVVFDVPPVCARFVLRGADAVAAAAGAALGVMLPRQACRSDSGNGIDVLWLGPDEWLLLAPEHRVDVIAATLAQALAGMPHSCVDVSHRDAALLLRGIGAADAINAGCPLDLDPETFPVGACTRTIVGKAEIVLWRVAADAFRVEAARSFMPYVHGTLAEAARGI